MQWVWTVVGVVVVLLALRDIFFTLWYPSGTGTISMQVMRAWWAAGRRLSRRDEPPAVLGPAGMASVIGVWAALVILGWALVYAPHMPGAFSFSPGLDSNRGPLLDSVYLSIVVVATLGLGDIVPTDGWMRVVLALQALTGFGLLTAAVSWVLQIYPALTRRRLLSLRLHQLTQARTTERLRALEGTFAAHLLEDLAADVTAIRVDLTQYAETFYFHDARPTASLPATLNHACTLAEAGQRDPRQDVALSAAVLTEALAEIAAVLRDQFLAADVPEETAPTLRAYARAHGHPVPE